MAEHGEELDRVAADLTDELVAAILANRPRINASGLARGASGFIELHVNQRMGAVEVKIVTSERGDVHKLGRVA